MVVALLDTSHATISTLRSMMEDHLGTHLDKKTWVPHITLARVVPRSAINQAAVNSINLNRGGRANIGTPFVCQRLVLRWIKSSGDEKDGVQSLEWFFD